MGEQCTKCHSDMKKGAKINSSNTIFQEWVCPKCNNKTMRATG